MATALPVTTIATLNPTVLQAFTFTAADAVDGNFFLSNGRETILMRNVALTGSLDVVIASVPDALERERDLEIAIAAGAFHVYKLGSRGWRDAEGKVSLTAESDEVEFAIIRDPL